MERAGTRLVLALVLAAVAAPAGALEQQEEPRLEPWYRDALVWEHPEGWLRSAVRSLERLRLQPGRDGMDLAETARERRPAPSEPSE